MDLDKLILGKDSSAFLVDSMQDNYEVLLTMLQQASHSLDMLSHHLDGSLYDTDKFIEALRQLALNHKNIRIRFLINDMNYIIQHGHRFIELARRLSSYIEIRQINSNFQHVATAYSIVDNRGTIFRSDASRFEARVNFNDPRYAHELQNQFTEIWNHSNPSQEMHSLHI